MVQEAKNSRLRKSRRTQEEIKGILLRYESSGLSAKEFCDRHQIKTYCLGRWQRRFRNNNNRANVFVEVSVPGQCVALEVGLIAEYRGIRFYQSVEPSYFKALVLC